jgi:hypothetical protein
MSETIQDRGLFEGSIQNIIFGINSVCKHGFFAPNIDIFLSFDFDIDGHKLIQCYGSSYSEFYIKVGSQSYCGASVVVLSGFGVFD